MTKEVLKVTINKPTETHINVDIEVPAERCKSSYQSALKRLSRSINLPGFRPGKVPTQVIIQKVGLPRIKASALEELIENSWKDAISQESIEPVTEAQLKEDLQSLVDRFNPEQNVSFTLEVEIAPQKKTLEKD